MINTKRRQAILYMSLAIIGMIILGVSLPDLRFQPGLPIPGAETGSTDVQTVQPGSSSSGILNPWILQIGLALGIILLFFALMTALLKKGNIKRVGLLAAILVLLFVFFSLLPRLAPERLDTLPDNAAVPRPPSFDYLVAPIGDPPAGLLFWVAAALLLVSVVLIGWSIVHAYRRTQKEDPLAIEAEAAVQAIADGQSLGNVIIRCYLNMERVIALEHGIERGEAVTPREFETYLEGKGIPRDPILQLTTLFEKARYGNQSLNEHDEREAVNCLVAIQKACQSDQRGLQ